MRATDELMRTDLRRLRAEALIAAIFDKLEPYLPYEGKRDAYDALRELLTQEGVEVMTDRTRQEAGLPARDGLGWTIEELVAMERQRLELLTQPIRTTILEAPERL